ncbi:MAG: hypothetical protein ABR909_03630 [Candidatus Bathyarchaeia archaeon]|jgi:hypothetical protein
MSKILGYGEDALTLWALKHHVSKILEEFQDKTTLSDCLIFYRPSFGRHGKANSSVFGEFDAILASRKNIYLIESKWDNLTEFNKDELMLRDEQTLRHEVFSWYLTHWNKKYYGNWQTFIDEHQKDFKFEKKTIARNSLLARNLESVLSKLQEHCPNFSPDNIKNVLLFFHDAKNTPPTKTNNGFTLISIDYSKEIKGNFVTL